MRRSIVVTIDDPSQVGEARRQATTLARALGFGEEPAGRVAIVVTEAATNLLNHARGGKIILREIGDVGEEGVEIIALDRGPGIVNLAKSMEDGFSTAGTKGNGLGSIKRLASTFELYSQPGVGTVLLAQLARRSTAPLETKPVRFQIGAICLPCAGEQLCGDAWMAVQVGARHVILVVDGLGHGPLAADTADQAVRLFRERADNPPHVILTSLHAAMRATRGAAVMIVALDPAAGQATCAGVGNIAGSILTGESQRSLVSHNGTIGHIAKKFNEFTYPWTPASRLVLHSDGLQTRWKAEAYAGIVTRHPSVLAGLLFRDFQREKDDVTVLVARQS